LSAVCLSISNVTPAEALPTPVPPHTEEAMLQNTENLQNSFTRHCLYNLRKARMLGSKLSEIWFIQED